MYTKNLSTAVVRFCKEQSMTYTALSELCSLEPRFCCDIARCKTVISLPTLEKLCVGMRQTPDELLLTADIRREFSFRCPATVTHIRCYRTSYGLTSYPICPTCKITMEREYQKFCDRCGQKLDWSFYPRAYIVMSP